MKKKYPQVPHNHRIDSLFEVADPNSGICNICRHVKPIVHIEPRKTGVGGAWQGWPYCLECWADHVRMYSEQPVETFGYSSLRDAMREGEEFEQGEIMGTERFMESAEVA
jgi:hypothetical protein